jgi:predicted AlkP superfamily phosphohydrolase/phosphomutase
LYPWIAWPTLHTGTSQEVHGIGFIGQHPNTFGATQIWDLVIEAGRKVGVFGSLLSWPPRPSAAFFIPECFARDAATHPGSASIVQRFNIKYSTENKKVVVAKNKVE